jgi:glycosyltransferase involved in cell wall biosynthesis
MRCPTLRDLPAPPPGKTGWPWTEESARLPPRMPDGQRWPPITIVTPSFNQGQFLEATIRSILLQGYPELEYFVLDGGSSDGSVDLIRRYARWITYWVSEPDGGQSVAINRGLERGSGVFATWINSDDMLCRDALVTQASRFGFRPNTVYVGCCAYIDAAGHTLSTHCGRVQSLEDLVRIPSVWRAPERQGHIVQPEVLFPRQLALEVGGLDPTNHRTMDYELWGKFLIAGATLQYTAIPFGMFRVHADQKTNDGWRQTQSLIATAVKLARRMDTVGEDTRQAILADLQAYENQCWGRTGRLARLGLPRSVVMRLRRLRAALERRVSRRLPSHGRLVSNILMTCPNDLGYGGVQVVFRDLIDSLERGGRHVHLLYQGPTTRPWLRQASNRWGRPAAYCPLPTLVRNSIILSVPVALAYLPLTTFYLVRLIRRHKIDVINCHYLAEYFVHLAIVARLLRLPLVVSVHGADIDRYWTVRPIQRLLLRLVMRGAHRVVACSKAMADETARAFPDVRAKLTHVHNGLIPDHLPAPRTPPDISRPFILSVCRQVAKKGTDTLLRAFAQVPRGSPGVRLVVIGDGPDLEKHRALAGTLGIEHQVTFLGDTTRDDVLAFCSACTVFVLSSRAEPFGLVLLEAAYYKRSIVCTAVGGVPEVITDGVSGFVVPPDDPTALAERIVTLLGNPRLRERFGARAHETLMARFRWDDRVRDYLAVYEGEAPPVAGGDVNPPGCRCQACTSPDASALDTFPGRLG